MKKFKLLIAIASIVSFVWISACLQDPAETENPDATIPAFVDLSCNSKDGFPATAHEYTQMVEDELGVVPTVILESMVEIPLYQNGEQVYGVFYDAKELDNPSRLGKLTVSGSALQRYEGKTVDGTPLPDVVWVAFLRNVTTNVSKPNGSLQLIGYNKVSGATAFFESMDNVGQYVSKVEPVTFKLNGLMPSPDNATAFNQAYRTPPSSFQCNSCHQADPFLTNPFINAAKIPGTNESVVPQLDANSPYYVIGGHDWDMRTIHIENNQCTSCHRVGLATARLYEINGYDINAHMPPHNPGSLAEDYIELLEAWKNGPANTPGANWIVPPACGESRKVVGDDYPYKDDFNEYN